MSLNSWGGNGKTVDVVVFNDEIDHLRTRIELLKGVVHRHIVIEGDLTHAGEPKELHLDGIDLPENVTRCVATLDPEATPWEREGAQRDFIARHWQSYVRDQDLLLVCDIDEYPNPAAMKSIRKATEAGMVSLVMRMFYYGLSWEDPEPWVHPKALRARDMPPSISAVRPSSVGRAVWGAGWHVSYAGGPERRSAKLRAFAHTEHNTPEGHTRVRNGDVTGLGPNNEMLSPVVHLDGVPDALVRRFGPRDRMK